MAPDCTDIFVEQLCIVCGREWRADGEGVIWYPNADELANGFRIGSDQDGNNQAKGTFDKLETFASLLNSGIAPAETYWVGIPDYQADPNGTLGAW